MSTQTHSEFPAGRSTRWSLGSRVTCVAAALLAISCAADPRHSPQQRQSDARATNEFYAKLNSDQVYYYSHVKIRVENGVAHLSGYVWNTEALNHAKEVASSVPGVTTVVDNLELEREGAR